MNKNPLFTPYKSIQDLLELREWFYNIDTDKRSDAVARVAVYQTRGNLAHSIESTSLLTSIVLQDEAGNYGNEAVLQLSYTMAIIKFVNGLLDQYQQAQYAMSLYSLANAINLPSYFVEVRHSGTHEFLPSLEMLRVVSKNALKWLYDNYWIEVDKFGTIDKVDDEEEFQVLVNSVRRDLKNFKKIRKVNLNKFYKFGDSTEQGIEYWKIINSLKKSYKANPDEFILILTTKKILILDSELTEGKINGLRLLYKPLLEELGIEFAAELLEALINFDNSVQCQRWCEYLLTAYKQGEMASKYDEIISSLSSKTTELNMNLLKFLLNQDLQEDQAQRINKSLSLMQKFYIAPLDLKRSSDSDSDVKLKKRVKPKDKIEMKLWEVKQNWEPTPFGRCI